MKSIHCLITGIPAPIASHVFRSFARLHPNAVFSLLVHRNGRRAAKNLVDGLIAEEQIVDSQVRLFSGEVEEPNLGLKEGEYEAIRGSVTHIFHLATNINLAVPQELAYEVNVMGTENVVYLASQSDNLQALVFGSTAFVSGNRIDLVQEHELECGQSLRNWFETSMYQAEQTIELMRHKVPAVIMRPSFIVGHSTTGEIASFSGVYDLMNLCRSFRKLAPLLPALGSSAKLNLVPIDFVSQVMVCAANQPSLIGKVVHIVDHNPLESRAVYNKIATKLTGAVPVPSFKDPAWRILLHAPWIQRHIGFAKQLLPYLDVSAQYATDNLGILVKQANMEWPPASSFIDPVIDYYVDTLRS